MTGPFDLLIGKIHVSSGSFSTADGGWLVTYGGAGSERAA